jgi:ribA/ribD-fused uncharacterized protein
MTYNIEWLINNFAKGKREKFVFFWGHQKNKDNEITSACLSQWWSAPFTVDGISYNTAERWMMAQKALLFGDKEAYEKVMAAKSPAEAKATGRQVRDFVDAVWDEKCFQIVVEGNFHKFSQHPDLKEFLLGTGKRILAEASPVDKKWGIGLAADDEKVQNPERWNGLNLLGFALMEVRDRLQTDRKDGNGISSKASNSRLRSASRGGSGG